MNATDKRTCSARNKRGEPCRARAIERGLCAVHSGRVNPAEIGRRGGSVSPQTKLRKAADDELREQARDVLSRALRGEDVPRAALDSARSLFSYRADAPPVNKDRGGDRSASVLADGRRVVGLADLLELCLEPGGIRGVFDGARMQDVILRAAEQVRELQAAGVRVETPKT